MVLFIYYCALYFKSCCKLKPLAESETCRVALGSLRQWFLPWFYKGWNHVVTNNDYLSCFVYVGHKAQASPSDVPKFTGWAQNQRSVPTESSQLAWLPSGILEVIIYQWLYTIADHCLQTGRIFWDVSKKPESTVTTLFSMLLAANKSRFILSRLSVTTWLTCIQIQLFYNFFCPLRKRSYSLIMPC